MKKILIVENDEVLSDLVEELLSGEVIVDTARNGEEALAKVCNEYFDVIITDIGMPVMTGIELYWNVVAKFPSAKERFLFFTGFFSKDLLSFFREHNVSYLEKPTNINNLTDTVAGMMAGRKKGGPAQ